MASQNVVFAIDVDYRPEETSSTTHAYENHIKHWILRVLLSFGNKYGLEKVRWGYKFFHSTTVKSAALITRRADFKELHEKAFGDFEEELHVIFNVDEKSPNVKCREKAQKKLKPSPSSCVQNALKEILLDFQWDRPDLTSPTKVTLRPRRSSRNGRNVPLQEDDLDKNVLFVVSACPRSKRELGDYVCLRRDDGRQHKDVREQVLSKSLIDMLMQRKVVLHWADSGILKAGHGVEDYTGIETVAELLGQVGGQVVPMLSPCLTLRDQHPGVNPALATRIDAFPIESTSIYVQSSETMHRQAFPPLGGSLCWIAGAEKQFCSVMLEPVSCRQRSLKAPVQVTLRGVLQGFSTLSRSDAENWILRCSDAELGQVLFQDFRELSTGGFSMLAEVSEGGVVCSAVLSVMSSCTALLTVLQPLVTQGYEHLPDNLVSSETTDEFTDMPDVVSSVLNVIYGIMENEDCSAPEEEHAEELSDSEQDLTSCLSELYESSTGGSNVNQRSNKRGTQRTPVRQKMKSMSRSLQMLNFARLNVKAQKTQPDISSAASAKANEKGGKKCTGDRTKPGLLHFTSEEELLSHLQTAYQKAVDNRSMPVLTQVQDLLSDVNAFIKINTDLEASFLNLVQKNLLKTCQSVRQLYGDSTDVDSKIRECQVQAVLRLELCKQAELEEEVVQQRVEEVADMLRIIFRSKDAVYLSKFMQDEILPVYLKTIPKVLADVYHSLGTQLPEALIAVLPSDFFSDESMAKDSISVSPSPYSATQSNVSSIGDHLEELRNRSAKKRRQSMLTRQKTMTEAPQALRQIEMPRKSTRQAKPKPCVPVEKPAVEEPPPQKQAVQEVTKVRRNLFNQVTVSPSKKSKMPRSQSVSAVEGLRKRKRLSVEEDEKHALLTKKVSETPLHKQVSNRLLHRQRTGRRSGESDVSIIEESPIKPAAGGFSISSVRSPVRLLFGATQSPGRLRKPVASFSGDQRDKDSLISSVFESQNKTPQKRHSDPFGSGLGCRTPRSPRTPSRTVGENGMALRGSPFRSPTANNMVAETPKKSPLKGILKTPMKTLLDCVSPNRAWLMSPSIRTPKKSVKWTPSPRKRMSENPVNVSESPVFERYSPNLHTPGKHCSPGERTDVFKTPDKVPRRKNKASPGNEVTGYLDPAESNVRSGKMRRALSLPCKVIEASDETQRSDSGQLSFCPSPLKPNVQTPIKSPSHGMCTRSGRTPVKELSLTPNKSQAILGTRPSPRKRMALDEEESCVSQSPGGHRSGISYEGCVRNDTGVRVSRTTKTEQRDSVQGKAETTSSSSDSQQFDCSEFSTTTTEDDSMDITEASVVKTQLVGGIKMNIAFSRKSSDVFEFKSKHATPTRTTPSRSYGFRQTPDRRQREAEARLGTPSGTPKFSTPRAQKTPGCGKESSGPLPPTYEVEMEIQSSGLPKLKLRRIDSFNAGDVTDSASKNMTSHLMPRNVKAPANDSPLAQCSRHREFGCVPPSPCSRGTPAKNTPGMGVQTYICQSLTPTRYPTSNHSPLASPLTPSPQSIGRSTPENLNSWPRKKRARIETYKEQVIIGVPLLEKKILEDPELEGVFRIQGVEELKEKMNTPVGQRKLGRSSQVMDRQPSPEAMDWTDTVYQDCDVGDTVKSEQLPWMSKKVDTPQGPKVKKQVSASGIFALTQSPLLYKKSTVTNEATQFDGKTVEMYMNG
ncbi:Treslin TopBP1-interacting checkpoint and replication regulator [Triplophysa tibetana]|uniref:Treslin TopBP1-interacting checkpoint and replication regulator n=1 Tax=Triplophysa tibetana TaxID=1572043 RepID=A0A5A9PQB0_9TELE|nr:Treslin TopBP1-interacting checkpoint and replication regulator [Triplophysa tibetana]